jgi:hypothetical protein
VTSRSHAARVWAVLLCLVVACAVVAVPAGGAPPAKTKHAKRAHAAGAHGKRAGAKPTGNHASRAKHPHRPTHPGAAKTGGHGNKRRGGHHGQRDLPVAIAPPPKLAAPKLPTGDPAKAAALWATPVTPPKPKHASHARVAPTWVIAVPAAAFAVLALGGLVHLARRWRRPTAAPS